MDMNMLQIRTATERDYGGVKDFYYSLIEQFDRMEYSPGWKKGVYPTEEFLSGSIKNRELYIGEIEGQIITCMAVNHEYNDGYNRIKWSVEASDEELLVIHILGVLPAYSCKGIAKEMVQKVIETARENKIKTIRLDVLDGNIPAEKAYTKMGFKYIDSVRMYYEDTGWTTFRLFEFVI